MNTQRRTAGKESKQSSRARNVAEDLTRAIHEHRLGPGMKLSEDEVGEIFGVSRTIVRTALQALAHDQLVTIEPHRGAFVAHPSIREAREVFEARALLEPRTANSAAVRATGADVAILQDHIDAEHAALAEGRTGQALRLSGQFHIEIARIADQSTIAEFIGQLVSRSSLVIALYWKRRTALCESHAHDALVKAIADHDPERAEELMKGHLLDLLSSLDLQEGPRAPKSLKEALKGQ
ncbi:Transcriptional regulator, GntR family [Rhodovulum sp. P5]|uniref:GntR family transcriptional regulator n=1 Tax=Rhodovulum sp. P5 TaxID=1564506 RepID=UPI0009C362A9|nr:GntR family transcriptional regulator [Rhodovulum sp. P5]ARE39479.1 Transcriptional regulator, GntR family [Rhodovulum sp. P5]